MSDTPRTDAVILTLPNLNGNAWDSRDIVVLADHARQLERAVSAAERAYALLSKIKLTSEDVFTLNGLGQALADLEKALEEVK